MVIEIKETSARAFGEILESDAPLLIDVRTRPEFREAHPQAAQHVSLSRLNKKALQELCSGERPIYFFCTTGQRAAKACQKAQQAGHENVGVVNGGLQAWRDAGLPVEEGPKSVSLERQVRTAAGFLVVLGVALGLTVHAGWLGLSGFVGAGLMFAGITDTCGMAMMLARLPWNR